MAAGDRLLLYAEGFRIIRVRLPEASRNPGNEALWCGADPPVNFES